MISLLYEPELLSVDATYELAGHALRPGLAFVACEVCGAPVDLSVAGEVWQRPLCDVHSRPALVQTAA